MFVPEKLRKTKEEMDVEIASEHTSNPDLLIMIDYVFHHEDEDYDGGLSFFDRLHAKLSRFYTLFWEPESLKKTIHSEEVYVAVVHSILDLQKVNVYGV